MKETKNVVIDNMGNTWSKSMFNNKSCDEMKGYIERIEAKWDAKWEERLIEATKEQKGTSSKDTSPNSDFHDCGCIVNCNCDDIENQKRY